MTTKKTKKAYDLTILLKEEDDSFVKDLIENSGGSDMESKTTKVNFAYEVEEETDGFMSVVNFWMPPDSAPTLNRTLQSEPRVLRHILLRDKLVEKKSKKPKQEKVKSKSKIKGKKSKQKQDAEEPLTNEAIEQKIEEILD